MSIFRTMTEPWPWYVAGPLIGLMVPLLLVLAGRDFGVSSSLQHICAACCPYRAEYFRYDWKRKGLWNLTFVAGIFAGGVIAAAGWRTPSRSRSRTSTRAALAAIGIRDFSGLVPSDLIGWSALLTVRGFAAMVVALLVGFGARWAGAARPATGSPASRRPPTASLIAGGGVLAGRLFVS